MMLDAFVPCPCLEVGDTPVGPLFDLHVACCYRTLGCNRPGVHDRHWTSPHSAQGYLHPVNQLLLITFVHHPPNLFDYPLDCSPSNASSVRGNIRDLFMDSPPGVESVLVAAADWAPRMCRVLKKQGGIAGIGM